MSKPNLWLKPIKYPNENWQATSKDVKALFGIPPEEKWPPEGMPKRTIQGIECWVEPFVERWGKHRWSDKPVKLKSSKHRTFGICPACGKTIPLGRMQQHAKIHKD